MFLSGRVLLELVDDTPALGKFNKIRKQLLAINNFYAIMLPKKKETYFTFFFLYQKKINCSINFTFFCVRNVQSN